MSLRKKKGPTQIIRIGIDTGGTFTDFVAARGSRLTSFKAPSTPHNPAEAILSGIARILGDAASDGFEDVIEIGRQARPDLYNLMVTRPAPLVPRELRFGVSERVGADGSIIT